jgi:hypothetical protein
MIMAFSLLSKDDDRRNRARDRMKSPLLDGVLELTRPVLTSLVAGHRAASVSSDNRNVTRTETTTLSKAYHAD